MGIQIGPRSILQKHNATTYTEILNFKAQFERKIMAKVCDIRNAHALNSIQM